MVVSRLTLGTAVLGLLTSMACSDRAGTITAQNGRRSTLAVSDTANADRSLRADDNQIIWGPAPPIFPPGALFAVLQGDPSKAGEIFTIRLRFPNGYVLPPHTHPTPEYVTVIRGNFLVGMGEDFSRAALTRFDAGDFTPMPAGMAHFAMTRGVTEVQVHAIGPFALTYIHPEDDPTKH
jgi:quercetin dioxygenase-like cupin family protein